VEDVTLAELRERLEDAALTVLDVRTQLEIIAEEYGAVRNLDVLGYWDANRPGDSDEWEAWKGREVTPIEFIANRRPP